MNIEARKILFIQEFLRIQNEEMLISLEKAMKQWKSKQYKKGLKPMSLELFNNEIDQALNDVKESAVIKATELREKRS